jgi:hypothetical protein
VATDGESYTLLALVWTPARASHVHDHPCDGCWMRVLRGEVRECRYRPVLGEGEDGKAVPHLECFQDEVYREDEQAVVFIEDCLGYHKVENPSPTQPAVPRVVGQVRRRRHQQPLLERLVVVLRPVRLGVRGANGRRHRYPHIWRRIDGG